MNVGQTYPMREKDVLACPECGETKVTTTIHNGNMSYECGFSNKPVQKSTGEIVNSNESVNGILWEVKTVCQRFNQWLI
jgi:hypothetical protein